MKFGAAIGTIGKGVSNARVFVLSTIASATFVIVTTTPVTLDTGQPGNVAVVANAAYGAKGGNSGGNGGGKGNGGGGGLAAAAPPGNGNGKGKNRGAAEPDIGIGEGSDRISPLVIGESTITMAQFTSAIRRRYPVDELTSHGDPHQAVSFFTELLHMDGATIRHVWRHEGETKFEARFEIRADRWRVWSTQVLPSKLPGEWVVEVVDQDGRVLVSHSLDYRPVDGLIAGYRR